MVVATFVAHRGRARDEIVLKAQAVISSSTRLGRVKFGSSQKLRSLGGRLSLLLSQSLRSRNKTRCSLS